MRTKLFISLLIISTIFLSFCTSRTANNDKKISENVTVIDTGKFYNIISVNSGKLLTVDGGSVDNGAKIVQLDANNGDNQKFKLQLLEDGSYQVICKKSNKSFDISGGSIDDGANLIQWEKNGGINQRFNFKLGDDKYFNIISKVSEKIIDIAGASKDAGVPAIQWTANGGDNQKFKLSVAN